MNIGKLLGAMSPGLGMLGQGAQGTGGLLSLSPMLALLLHHKNSGGAAATPPPQAGYTPPPTASVLAPPQPMAQAPGPGISQMAASTPQIADPSKRKQLGYQLLQLGGQISNPFGPRY